MPTSIKPSTKSPMKNSIASLIGIFLATCVLSFGASHPKEGQGTSEGRLQVEVLIFSGRPNPIFTIEDPQEIREVMALLNGLPEHPVAKTGSEASAISSKLGFRGLAVTNLSTVAKEIRSFELGDSNVKLKRESTSAASGVKPEFRQDSSKAVQRKLLEIGKSRGAVDAGLMKLIEGK